MQGSRMVMRCDFTPKSYISRISDNIIDMRMILSEVRIPGLSFGARTAVPKDIAALIRHILTAESA